MRLSFCYYVHICASLYLIWLVLSGRICEHAVRASLRFDQNLFVADNIDAFW